MRRMEESATCLLMVEVGKTGFGNFTSTTKEVFLERRTKNVNKTYILFLTTVL